MKTKISNIIFLGIIFVLLASAVFGQNLLKNGDFSSGSENWTEFTVNTLPAAVDFNYEANIPKGAKAPALRITANDTNSSWTTNHVIYQSVELEAGKSYELDFNMKDISNGKGDQWWFEVFIMDSEPQKGKNFLNDVAKEIANNGFWHDGIGYNGSMTTEYYLPAKTGKYYIIFKIGCSSICDVVIDDVILREVAFDKNHDTLTILSTNDFHASIQPKDGVGGSAMMGAYVDYYRAKQKDAAWVIAGDYFQGSPLDSSTKGEAMINILNIVSPDVFEFGNHEFDYGKDILIQRMGIAKFPFLCANLVDEKTGEPFAKPYIIKDIDGVKTLFIGVISEGLKDLTSEGAFAGYKVVPVKDTVEKITSQITEDIDLTVVVSHIGLHEDSMLAKNLTPKSGVDVIVGGHTHDLTFTPRKINGILIAQAGEKGKYLGKLDLNIDAEKNSVSHYKWQYVEMKETAEIKPNKQIADYIAEQEKSLGLGLDDAIGKITIPLNKERKSGDHLIECNLGNFSTDIIAKALNVDICFQNRGGLRKNIDGPNLTIRDIWEVFPFDNYWVKFKINPKEIYQILEGVSAFEGEQMLFSKAVRYTFDSSKPKGQRVVEVLVNDKKIDRNDTKTLFTCTTISFAWSKLGEYKLNLEEIKARGDFSELKDRAYRDYYIDYIKENPTVDFDLDNRVIDVAK